MRPGIRPGLRSMSLTDAPTRRWPESQFRSLSVAQLPVRRPPALSLLCHVVSGLRAAPAGHLWQHCGRDNLIFLPVYHEQKAAILTVRRVAYAYVRNSCFWGIAGQISCPSCP